MPPSKETYASTGTLMVVRFFGGFDLAPADADTRELGALGYQKGVPMGGDLKAAPAGKTPTFLVAAAKGPLSGNLDRIQPIGNCFCSPEGDGRDRRAPECRL